LARRVEHLDAARQRAVIWNATIQNHRKQFMTAAELIAEGRRLARPTILLVPDGRGDPAAIWYEQAQSVPGPDGHQCRLSVDARFIPHCKLSGWLSVFTDEESCEGGRVDLSSAPPKLAGTRLYAKPIEVLPPIDAVIARGSIAVDKWLEANGWQRDWRYNNNFGDHTTVAQYEAIEQRENPLFWKDAYAKLGGWHTGWPDDDWHDLLDAKLLVHTYMDSEPWVEAWQLPSGNFKVIQRIT
jgi:hypothetical protein